MLAVLLNPLSGAATAEGIGLRIHDLFRAQGVEVAIHELHTADEIATTARAALERHPDAVVAAGGDGTVNAVASVLAGGLTPLGVLPLGTRNHFAKDLGVPLALDAAVQTIAQRHLTRVDVGRVADRVFLNNCSIGIYPDIVEARERLRRLGHRKWTALLLATTEVLRRGDEVLVRLDSGDTRVSARTPFLFVGNNEYLSEGIHIGARTRLDGGRLCAYFAPPVHTRDLPKLFAHALLGHARQNHALESISAEEFWVDTPSAAKMKVACDGEILMLAPPLHYRAWPGALTVIVPAA